MMDDELTIRSAVHGDRVWRRIGERDYTCRDGREIVLAVWETRCVVCNAPFQIKLSIGTKRSHAFETTTCPAHRMSAPICSACTFPAARRLWTRLAWRRLP
jgi:hypothetical protein